MRSSSKAGLFLIELIIAIAFFALCSAVCMRLFAHSHTVSRKSNDLSMAVNSAQTAAECFRSAGGDIGRVAELMPGSKLLGQSSAMRSYNRKWQPDDNGEFLMTLDISSTDGMSTGIISIKNTGSGETIYGLEVKLYTGTEGGA